MGGLFCKPGYNYTYTVAALKGSPENLVKYEETQVEVTTESGFLRATGKT